MKGERRIYPRMRTLLRGKAIFRGGHCAMECHVLEVSDGGARIKLSDCYSLPDRFRLSIGGGPLRPVEVRHRDIRGIGVQFADSTA
jgi:hypothetical protein